MLTDIQAPFLGTPFFPFKSGLGLVGPGLLFVDLLAAHVRFTYWTLRVYAVDMSIQYIVYII